MDNGARSQVRIALQRQIQLLVETGPDARTLMTPGPEKRFYINNDMNHFPRPGEESVEAFGAVLFERVRARPKQGDLDFQWQGLNTSISLAGAVTVNDLIARIHEATQLELYADRRYGELGVYIRGESARAGDVLRALCLGVSGAIRKVGPAFVLTEDREGFGTRQVLLTQWTAAASQARNRLIMASNNQLVKAPVDGIPWASDDPMRPDANLANQINAFRTKYQTQSPEERRKRENRELRLAITELPAPYQQSLQRQFESMDNQNRNIPAEVLEQHPELAANRPQLRKDSVVLEEKAGFVVLVPGYGRVESVGLFGFSSTPGGEYISWDRPRVKEAPPMESFRYPDVVTLPEQPASRTLVVAVETTEEAKQAVTEAKRLGFDTLWVEVKPEQKALLEAAVAAGKEQKVAIGAVVRVLRSFRKTTLPADQNMRGETSLKMAERFAQNPLERVNDFGGGFIIGSDGTRRTQILPNTPYDLTQARRVGDWLQPLSAENQAASVANILSLGRTLGIVGLILRDLIPPGYRSPGGVYDYQGQLAELEALGYSEEMRLAFLRQYSVDPIDLSPNGQGNIPYINKPFAQVSYPLFPDYGLTGKYGNGWGKMNGVFTYDMGAKDAQEKWLEYRVATNQNLIRSVIKQVQSALKVPLYWLNDQTDRRFSAGRWSALLPDGEAGIAYLTPPPQPRQVWPPIERGERPEVPRKTPVQIARPGAKNVYATFYFVPRTEGDLIDDFRQQAFSAFGQAQKGWDGIVVDMTMVPLREAIRLLEQVPMRYEPPKQPQ